VNPHSAHPQVARYLAGLSIVFFLSLYAGAMLAPGSFAGEYSDPDSYTRLLRVEKLLSGGTWHDTVIERADVPFGLRLHWTRPMDVVLAAPALPARPFVGVRRSLQIAAAVVPPFLLALLGIVGAFGARALRPDTPVPLAAMIIALQPGVLNYGMPGNADHHVLFLLAFVAVMACLLRAVLRGWNAGYALAGAAAGFGLWVSIESILYWALGALLLGSAWIWSGGSGWRRAGLLYCGAAAGVAAVALVIERPLAEWGSTDLHRISAPYVLIPALAGLFWLMVPPLKRFFTRAAACLVGATVAGAAVLTVQPAFLRGPFAELDPALRTRWLDHVVELQPILMPTDAQGTILFVSFLALPAAVWVGLGARVVRDWGGTGAAMLAVGVLYTLLALREARWAPYAALVAGLVLAAHIPAFYAASRRWRPRALAVVARASIVAGLVICMPVLARAGAALMGKAPATESAECDPVRAVAELPAEPLLNVLAHVDHGPRLLYHTPHRVLAAPYHLGTGMLEAYRIMSSASDQEALARLQRRGIDLIVLCPVSDRSFFDSTGEGETTLYRRIIRGDLPSWLLPVSQPANAGTVVLRVDRR
jgi:asparagine N-glycosylation enzyme membrane subunit Stt3